VTGPVEVVIVAGARTPQGRIGGQLASLTAVELGAVAAKEAIARAGITANQVEWVIFGNVLQAGLGQNPARQTAIAAGIPLSVPATTINRVCLSGLSAVVDAARLIRSGDAQVVLAGGQESMSRAPYLLPGARAGWRYGDQTVVDSVALDGLTDATSGQSMGSETDRGNTELRVSRAEQDVVALRSHGRAAQASENGRFAREIAPVTISGRSGDILIDRDEGIRKETSLATLAKLKPSFLPDGSVTAGNASPLTDGATALVIASGEYAKKMGLPILAVIGHAGQIAGPDTGLHDKPARALLTALAKSSLGVRDLDVIEINEAFAAVVVETARLLDIDDAKINPNGGAIAIGHPIGASGARLVLTAAYDLASRGGGVAGVAICGGGGQGDALLLSLPRTS
jgi:acetyl-CoA C-acetyltransferase